MAAKRKAKRAKLRCKGTRRKARITKYSRCEAGKKLKRNTVKERRMKKCLGGAKKESVTGHARRVCHA